MIRSKEEVTLKTQLQRAKNENLPATLTLEQWLENIALFNGMCAYCRKEPYKALDHIVPISKKGGTTQSNCVPACKRCNDWKRAKVFDIQGTTLGEITYSIYQKLQNYKYPLREYPPRKNYRLIAPVVFEESAIEKIYTPEQVAEILSIDLDTVMHLIANKQLRAKKVGRMYRISEKWLQDYLNKED